MTEHIYLLKKNPIFKDLNHKDLQQLLKSSVSTNFAKNQCLFIKGEIATSYYFIISGLVSIETMSLDGKNYRYPSLTSGELFGELAILGSFTRTATARALRDSIILKLDGRTLMALIKTKPQFGFSMINHLVNIIRTSNDQVESLLFDSLYTRVCKFLLYSVENNNSRNAPNPMEVIITQKAIAENVSAAREKVNVILQKLQSDGGISISHGKILVTNYNRLKCYIDENI